MTKRRYSNDVDHPDNVLVAWIAGASHRQPGQGAVMNRKLTACLLILAAVLANVAFTALGSIFNYPDVLDEPAGKVLAAFRDDAGRRQRLVPRSWRSAAALLAPIAIGVGRLSSRARDADRRAGRDRRGRRAGHRPAALADPRPRLRLRRGERDPGVAAAARDSFTTASDILGTAIGETLGYLLTATWTVLVIVALGRRYAGRWFQVLGAASAALVLVGVLSPLDLPVIDTANFLGYVLWSVWLIAFAVVILVHERRRASAPAAVTS